MPPTTSPPSFEPSQPMSPAGRCLVCLPGFQLSLSNAVISIPEGFVQGITQATCNLLDSGLATTDQVITAQLCQALRAQYEADCGCVATDPNAPMADAPVVPTPGCTICPEGQDVSLPNQRLSLPNQRLTIPEGFIKCQLWSALL